MNGRAGGGSAQHRKAVATSTIILSGVGVTLAGAAGKVPILHDINLTVAAGESLAITGPSGSGKSTLLSVIGGLERPDTGSVTIAGQSLNALSEDRLAIFRRDHLGIVFQSFHLVPTMTAEENVAIPLELAGRRGARDLARRELEAVGLGHRSGHYPSEMSGGEQQRVALARAVIANPAILLADEPTGNLDSRTGQAVIDLLFSLREHRGRTLILVTHDPHLAECCDRVIELVDGRMIRDRPGRAPATAPRPVEASDHPYLT